MFPRYEAIRKGMETLNTIKKLNILGFIIKIVAQKELPQMKHTITSQMGIQYEVKTYRPLFDFETSLKDWLKAFVWGFVMPIVIFLAIDNALYMIAYVLAFAGLYAWKRNFTPVSVFLYVEAFMVVATYIGLFCVTLMGAAIASY
jgi:hypothetical protein